MLNKICHTSLGSMDFTALANMNFWALPLNGYLFLPLSGVEWPFATCQMIGISRTTTWQSLTGPTYHNEIGYNKSSRKCFKTASSCGNGSLARPLKKTRGTSTRTRMLTRCTWTIWARNKGHSLTKPFVVHPSRVVERRQQLPIVYPLQHQ